MKIINNKTIYKKMKIDMKDMLLNKPSFELSNKQNIGIKQKTKKKKDINK